MGDFIKELNIIDFLGLLLPGSFLLLMVNYTQTHKLTGLEFTAADIIFLIVGGYVVGSLLHDVWEFIESIIWKKFLPTNPQIHAARDVDAEVRMNNIDFIDLKNDVEGKKPIDSDTTPNERNDNKTGNDSQKNDAQQGTRGAQSDGKQQKTQWWDGYHWICQENPMIQTILVEKGNYRKRIVFDGFHVMMRNLFCASILTIVIPLCVGIPVPLYDFLSEYIKNSLAVVIIIAAGLALMAWRSWHYAYLKYKYSYEDFMILCADKNIKDKPVL